MQIHHAAARGDKETLLRHLQAGMPVDDRNDDSYGGTALIWAAGSRNADVSVLALLIEHGADVNAITKSWHSTPLTASKYQEEKFRFLLQRGAQPIRKEHGSYLLYPGVSRDLVRTLLDQGVDPRDDPYGCNSALVEASRDCRWEHISLFFEYGVTIEDLDWSPLMRAIIFGSVEEVSLELTREIDLSQLDTWNRTPFLLAVCLGDIQKAEMLIAAGSSFDERGHCGYTCIHYAAQKGQIEMLRWLLSQGLDVNVTNEFGKTPLMAASANGQASTLQALLNAGAIVTMKNDTGIQAINRAASPEVVELLVRAGADLDFVDPTGSFLLKEAAETRNEALVKCILSLGANVNTLGGGVGTALNAATNADELGIISLLLQAGADPDIMDGDQWRALWYVRSLEAAKLLVEGNASLELCDMFGRTAIQHHRGSEIHAYLASCVKK